MANPIRWNNVAGVAPDKASIQATALFNNALSRISQPLADFNDNKVANLQANFKQEREDNTAKMLQAKLLGTEYTPANDNYDKTAFLKGSMEVEQFNQNQGINQGKLDKIAAEKPYLTSNADLTNQGKQQTVTMNGLDIKGKKFKNSVMQSDHILKVKSSKASLLGQQLSNVGRGLSNAAKKYQNSIAPEMNKLNKFEINSRIAKNNRMGKGGSGKGKGSGKGSDVVDYLFNTLKIKDGDRPLNKSEKRKEIAKEISKNPKVAMALFKPKNKSKSKSDKFPDIGGTKSIDIPFNIENSPDYQKIIQDVDNMTTTNYRKPTPTELFTSSTALGANLNKNQSGVLRVIGKNMNTAKKVKEIKSKNLTKTMTTAIDKATNKKASRDEWLYRYNYKKSHN